MSETNQPLPPHCEAPGRYDHFAAAVRDATKADGVFLIVLNGNKGFGFSMVAVPRIIHDAPDILHTIANVIEGREGAQSGSQSN